MKKGLKVFVVVVLAAAVIIAAAREPIVKFSVEKGVKNVTGLKLGIAELNIGIMKTVIGITDLKLFNPPGFEDRIMFDMPEVYVHYDLPSIIGGKIHLREMRLNMSEFIVVKNEKGELNLDALNVVKDQKKEAKPDPAKKDEAPEIQIDVLELEVGRVLYKDYSKGGKPSVQEFKLNLKERYTDITDPNKLVGLIVVKALANTTIARLANFDLKDLEGTIGDTLGKVQEMAGAVQGVAGGAGSTATQITQKAEGLAKETTQAVQKTAEDLQKVIQFPFSGSEE